MCEKFAKILTLLFVQSHNSTGRASYEKLKEKIMQREGRYLLSGCTALKTVCTGVSGLTWTELTSGNNILLFTTKSEVDFKSQWCVSKRSQPCSVGRFSYLLDNFLRSLCWRGLSHHDSWFPRTGRRLLSTPLLDVQNARLRPLNNNNPPPKKTKKTKTKNNIKRWAYASYIKG